MKYIILFFISLLFSNTVFSQLYIGAELGYHRSLTRFDASNDPEQSIDPMQSEFMQEQLHIGWQFSKYFRAGLHIMAQPQGTEVQSNRAYFEKKYGPYQYGPWIITPQYSQNQRSLQTDEFGMAGPEFTGIIPIAPWLSAQLSISALFFDNRQQVVDFKTSLDQQYEALDPYFGLNRYIAVYSADAEYLNGWNTKLNLNLQFILMPFKSKSHQISMGFSTGRCTKQNYAVNFRTASDDSPSHKNILHASNYGEYYSFSLGYYYTLNFKKK